MTGTIDSLMQTSVVKNVTAADAISASLSSLIRASLVNLKPGEDALAISTNSVNMSNAIFYAATLTNKTLSPPGTNNSVVLPPGGAAGFYSGVESTDEINTAVMSIKKLKKDKRGKNSTSHVLRFSITTGSRSNARRLSEGDSDSVSTSLQTNSPQAYSVGFHLTPWMSDQHGKPCWWVLQDQALYDVLIMCFSLWVCGRARGTPAR
jgi:hypothetical protein